MTFDIRVITAAAQRPLRHRVLRPHQPPDQIVYPGDDAADSAHFGAYFDDQLVGIASVVREPRAGETGATEWRLRGMATAPEVRRMGYGAALVGACIEHARQHGGTLLWCAGRTSAVPFYQSLGFAPTGEEFDVAYTGPHYIMVLPL